MSAEKVRVSIVNYTNTLPFKWALKRSPMMRGIELQEDIPSICAQKLKFGQVDLALVPVALLPELENYTIISDYCIGANGKVDSVKLYSEVPLNEIKIITLDYQSKTSIALTRILCKFAWGLDVRFMEARPGFEEKISGENAAVVIGDRTFSMNGHYPHEVDLAEAWRLFTGLPFVFAAWVHTHPLPPDFISTFNAVLSHGIDNVLTAIDEDYTGKQYSRSQTIEYLTQRIDYHFDDGKRKALVCFLEYMERL